MPWFPCKINFSLPLWLFLDFPSKYNIYPEKKTDYAVHVFINCIVKFKTHRFYNLLMTPQNIPASITDQIFRYFLRLEKSGSSPCFLHLLIENSET